MGGNRNAGNKRAGNNNSRNAGKSRGGGNNAAASGGRNVMPGEQRTVLGKGKHAMTAVPGKELKAAANAMMANVMKRRRHEESHRPGQAAPAASKAKTNLRVGLPEESDAGFGDEEQERARRQQSALRQTTAMAMDARTRQAFHAAAQNSIQQQARKDNTGGDGLNSGGSADDDGALAEYKEKSLKRFFKNVKDVIDQSDVLLEVVDARDPMGCRLGAVEDMIENEFGGRKKIVLVINKTDLLPAVHNPADHRHAPQSRQQQQQQHQDDEESVAPLASWMRYFREREDIRISEVCPFTCSSHKNGGGAAAAAASSTEEQGNGGQFAVTQEWCVQNLFNVLRRLATVDGKDGGVRRNINVGVIGYPNVGKSSIINALRGKTVVGVGNTPGFTTGNQLVDLRKDIKIIDCPGVVMPGEDAADIVLRNAAKIERLHDPVIVVSRLLARCDPVALAMYYDVPIPHVPAGLTPEQYGDVQVMNAVTKFLQNVAWKRGRVRQAGSVDEEDAARLVLKDWNDGRISYYSLPPEIDRFTFSGVNNFANTGNNAGGPQMMSSISSSSIVFGRTNLPRFFLSNEGTGEFRVEWSQDTMFRAAPGADAPIVYNPMDLIDEKTGLPLDPNWRKNKKKAAAQQQQQPLQGGGNAQQQQQQVAQQFLSGLYDD